MIELLPVACGSFLSGWIFGRALNLSLRPRLRRGSNAPNRPGPGMRREYLYSPSTVAECGGPCEAGPEHCHCGQLWRDVPIRLDEGRTQRGNGSGGPTTPKPDIVPKPQPPPGRVVDIYGRTIGYQPRSHGGNPNPPPEEP